MKIILKLDRSEYDLDEVVNVDRATMEEELKQELFEVCEDWVLRGQEPNLKFE